MNCITTEQFALYWTKAMPTVSAFVGTMVPDKHEADDVVQEVAMTLVRKLNSYDASRPFVPWAIGVAKRKILTSRRRYAMHPLLYSSEVMDVVAETCERISPELERRKEALQQCVEQMPFKGRTAEVFSLHYRSDMEPRHIAEALGISSGTIRVMLNRMRDVLRDCTAKRLGAMKA